MVLPEVLLERRVELDVAPVGDEERDLSVDGVSELEVGEVVGLGSEEVESRVVVGVLEEQRTGSGGSQRMGKRGRGERDGQKRNASSRSESGEQTARIKDQGLTCHLVLSKVRILYRGRFYISSRRLAGRRKRTKKKTSSLLQLLPLLRRIILPNIPQSSILPELPQSLLVGVSVLSDDGLEELGSSKSESEAKNRNNKRVEPSSACLSSSVEIRDEWKSR